MHDLAFDRPARQRRSQLGERRIRRFNEQSAGSGRLDYPQRRNSADPHQLFRLDLAIAPEKHISNEVDHTRSGFGKP